MLELGAVLEALTLVYLLWKQRGQAAAIERLQAATRIGRPLSIGTPAEPLTFDIPDEPPPPMRRDYPPVPMMRGLSARARLRADIRELNGKRANAG